MILVGVVIASLTQKTGILIKMNNANIENRGASVQEARDLWKANGTIDNYSEIKKQLSLEELLEDLESQNLINSEEKKVIEETGRITIGTRTIVFGKPPKIELAEVSNKTIDSITVRVKAMGKEKLTYSFYIQKEGESYHLGQILENQIGGEEVSLTAEHLSNYTYYDWYVIVSEGEEKSYFSANERVRTYCPSGQLECKGPFIDIIQCDECSRKRKNNKTL